MKLVLLNSKEHNRNDFNCGEELLDNYLKKQVSQDIKRNLTTCTVLINENNIVKGYYTLSSSSVNKETLPLDIINKFPPSYIELPVVLLGRLAIDNSLKYQGFGALVLLDALHKCLRISEQLGILGIVVDPISEEAISFYTKYGFRLLPSSKKMIISIKTIQKLL